MLSRSFTHVLLIVLTSAVIYIALKQSQMEWPKPIEHESKPELLPIKEAIKESRFSTIRSNTTISVESCNTAKKEFLSSTHESTTPSGDNLEIEKALSGIMAEVKRGTNVGIHLTCLLHQLPVKTGRTIK